LSATRYKLRIYKASEAKKIQSLYLDTKNVFDIASHAGRDLISSGSAAITFDDRYQDILNVYLRVCEISLSAGSGQSCDNPQILGFDKSGVAQSSLQISNFATGGNFILESPNGVDMFAKSGFTSEFKKYNFASATWETLAGNNTWGSVYCLNGVANSACSLRMKDAFYDPVQKIVFVLDQAKIRIVAPDVNKIFSLIE
jgi:hypothetical protein